MARILITYYRSDELSAGTTLCFFDSLFQELKRFGNNVLAVNMAYYGIFNPNTTDNKCFEEYLLQEAVRFSPDFIIAFNHHILRAILETIDVPVVIYDGDELRYFADLDIIKQNIGRYRVFSIVQGWRQDYLDFGFQENQVFYMPPGTAITRDAALIQDKPISFLGQRRYFLSNRFFDALQQGKDAEIFYKTYADFVKNKDYHYLELFHRNGGESGAGGFEESELWPLFDQSYLIFANLLDLGLHLGGHEGAWCDIAPFVPQLAAAHDRSRVFNLEENQRYYNSSVLSLCPMHPQAKGKGFSWRCYDVMGSSACLVASTSTELREQTRGWVDLPMFDTPAEAREICIDLLENREKREELIARSNAFVNEKGRWEQRFAQMESILGIPLLREERQGSFRKLTERPVWMEDPGAVPVPAAAPAPAAEAETAHQSTVNPEGLRRWKRKIFLEKLHVKSTNPVLLCFACAGEVSMLAVCAAAQTGVFSLCVGDFLSALVAWVSGMGALAFFGMLCVIFSFKFAYKAALWVLRRFGKT